jgi:hypothetical protein
MAALSAFARPGDPAQKGKIAPGPKSKKISFEKDITPLLNQYCFACHGNGKKKGGLALDAYKEEALILKDQSVWEKVMQNLDAHVMPPENKKQPSLLERELIVKWIQTTVFKCDCDHPDPGRVTVRRLNRAGSNECHVAIQAGHIGFLGSFCLRRILFELWQRGIHLVPRVRV